MSKPVVTRSFRAIGTTAVVAVTDPGDAAHAELLLGRELDALDAACSRFRADSEINLLYQAAGAPIEVSDLLFDVVRVACDVAAETAGAVDPTVGHAMEVLGYDRDYASLTHGGQPMAGPPVPAPGWWTIELDTRLRTICVPEGVRIDVGSSAKAYVADRAAAIIAANTGGGVLVSLGGDIATGGAPPPDGWQVGIAMDSSAPLSAVDQVVALEHGALASSSPGVRTWDRDGRRRHHIVDPRTGDCAPEFWRLVSVVAPTCVEANALSTAAVVWGRSALPPLVDRSRPARLVRHDGEVIALNGWPEDHRSTLLAGIGAVR
ncbi:MAG TPA: FAD:protein FMN transferase [Acidimicrobiales bacterium]|nr:FAD:protein FMN transferase [Acidimicrobiales bacterium]